MTGLPLALTAVGLMLAGVFLRVPIAIAMGMTGFFGTWYVMGAPTGPMAQLKHLSYETFSNQGLAIVPLTLYLSLSDALAIGSGTWTINPEQSLDLLLGGILPLEELLFFLLTNTLVTFGVTLMLAPETLARFSAMRERWRGRFTPTHSV